MPADRSERFAFVDEVDHRRADRRIAVLAGDNDDLAGAAER
jgi:hypothetical protein